MTFLLRLATVAGLSRGGVFVCHDTLSHLRCHFGSRWMSLRSSAMCRDRAANGVAKKSLKGRESRPKGRQKERGESVRKGEREESPEKRRGQKGGRQGREGGRNRRRNDKGKGRESKRKGRSKRKVRGRDS